MINFKGNTSNQEFEPTSSEDPLHKLNKLMERLRARLYTLAEAALPPEQANSFKKALKDYTSETWNKMTDLISELKEQDNVSSGENFKDKE